MTWLHGTSSRYPPPEGTPGSLSRALWPPGKSSDQRSQVSLENPLLPRLRRAWTNLA